MWLKSGYIYAKLLVLRIYHCKNKLVILLTGWLWTIWRDSVAWKVYF